MILYNSLPLPNPPNGEPPPKKLCKRKNTVNLVWLLNDEYNNRI